MKGLIAVIMDPIVSVVIPVFNGQDTVMQAIESILNQTFTNFEVVVIDDGSTDGTIQILRSISDARVIIKTQENLGAGAARRRGVEISRGRYVAVQDSDDRSFPTRLQEQVKFLDAHPKCVAVGTWSEIQGIDNSYREGHRHPTSNGALQFLTLFDSYFVASSVMMRKSKVLDAGNYMELRNGLEDFELWSRLRTQGDLANIPQVLMTYREMSGSLSRSRLLERDREAIAIAASNIRGAFGHKILLPCQTSLVLASAARQSGQRISSVKTAVLAFGALLIITVRQIFRNRRDALGVIAGSIKIHRNVMHQLQIGISKPGG